MLTTTFRPLAGPLAAGLVVLLPLLAGPPAGGAEASLPRFTEEREAAALFFIKKHVPEVLPLLEEMKKSNAEQYQKEIREVFQVTEMLADLEDDPPRHDLELKIWVTESKAHALVAKLATPNEEERKKAEEGLRELARKLVELDIQDLQQKADQLKKDLTEVEEDLAKAREQQDKNAQARYEALLEQAKRRKK
jgi:hypothetical protein